jgi:MFS family permease
MVGAQGIGIGAFSVFLPTFIHEFGFSVIDTQLYSIIPYAFGLTTLIIASYISDRFRCKAFILLICMSISITGFILLLLTTNTVALVAGACFVLAGAYPALAVSVAWLYSFHGGFTKRAFAAWFAQIFIQGESIIATQVYDSPPRYFKGHGIALGFYVLAVTSVLVLYVLLRNANAERDRKAQEQAGAGLDENTFEDLCDFHPDWRYAL